MISQMIKNLFTNEEENKQELILPVIEETESTTETEVPNYFSAKELMCKCGCKEMLMDEDFMRMLNTARHTAGKPWKITSAYRCPKHNKAVGGSNNSTHMAGKAVDISAPTSQKKFEIISNALSAGFTRIGVGKNFIHLDSGNSPKHPQCVVWTY